MPMNCEKIRGLLTSDYIDGELDEGARADVVRHLETCTRCRQLEEAVRRAAVEPFTHAQLDSAPASVWNQVALAIDREREGIVPAAIRRGWERLSIIRRAAYGAASLAALILLAAILIRLPFNAGRGARLSSADVAGVRDYLREQLLALDYQGDNGTESIGDGSADYDDTASVSFGTIVEEYLI